MKTILEAKSHLRKNFKSGTNCPACGQLVKAYKRKLNANMCKALAIIYTRTGDGVYIHVQNVFSLMGLRATAMDYSYLEKWKFIETDPNNNGYWRVTKKGKEFITNQLTVPAYCLVYGGEVYEWADEKVDVEKALTKQFKLADIMQIPLRN